MAKLGRPVAMSAEDRRKEIFMIAEKLFGEQGFEHVTMSQIAAAAGMSKKTLYVYFSDKRQLLQSLVASSYIWTEQSDQAPHQQPIEQLKQHLNRIMVHVLSDRHIKLCRLAIAEQVNIEGATATFYEMGISTSRNHLITALKNIPQQHYRLALAHDIMADLLFGAIIAKPFIDLLLIAKTVDYDEIQTTMQHVLSHCFQP